MTPQQAAVEQCDREAAANLADKLEFELAVGGNDLAAIRNGTWDEVASSFGSIVQAFARHRIAALRPSTPAEDVERVASRAVHEFLCKRDIMEYLNNDEDCLGVARAVLAALSRPTAVGEAVLAERERCARVLDKLEPPRRRWINRADAIAAIRTPPAPLGDAE